MDPFQKVPFYVLLQIVKSVQDLPSLLHLLHASPVVASLFHDCALEIFDAVVEKSIPSSIQGLLYTVAYVRAGKTASHGLYDFISKIGSYCVHDRNQIPTSNAKQHPPSNIFRQMLMLSCHIQHLGYQCIHDMLQQCLTLKPSHLVDENSPKDPTGQECYFHPRPPHPLMQPYQVHDSGPPSWVEVQRVYRALWRLQLFLDVQKAASGDTKLNWPPDHVQKILNMVPEIFWGPMEHSLLEELKTVKGCVERLYPNWFKTQLPIYRGNICYNWPTLSLDNLVPQYSHLTPAAYLNYRSRGFPFIEELSRTSVLPYVGFSPFRRYGLVIWDRKRLMALELDRAIYDNVQYYSGIHTSITNLYYTWWSIMTDEGFQFLGRESADDPG